MSKQQNIKLKILKKKENGYNLIQDPEQRQYDLIELQIGNDHNRKICIEVYGKNITIYSRNGLISFQDMKDYYPKYLVKLLRQRRKKEIKN